MIPDPFGIALVHEDTRRRERELAYAPDSAPATESTGRRPATRARRWAARGLRQAADWLEAAPTPSAAQS